MSSRTRIQSARNGGRGAAERFAAAGLAAACLAGARLGWAGRAAEAAASAPERHVFTAGAQSDTLDHACRDVFGVAMAELEADEWEIQRADSAGRRIVTRWKPVAHGLVRLAVGKVWARCVVDLEPLPDGRTRVEFLAGLASRGDLSGTPAMAAAQLTFQRAAERWVDRVRGRLERAETAVRLTP
jgi:hypothetical protein